MALRKSLLILTPLGSLSRIVLGSRVMLAVLACCHAVRKRRLGHGWLCFGGHTLKKYKSRPRAVAGALLPFHGVWPSMTITKHINDARVRHMGVRIHAKRPTLPMVAAVG